jgi:SagB-type dehydrogenase family enzyme
MRHREYIATENYERVDRPYPSAGGCHELELYPIVGSCDGITPGSYHYVTDKHQLERMCGLSPDAVALITQARKATGMEADPQILIIVSARFRRVSWKYESIAYSLILKHVGILYQTMYLVATAMDLAPCALGGGDSIAFSRLANTDPYDEGSVGEFIIGSKENTPRRRSE